MRTSTFTGMQLISVFNQVDPTVPMQASPRILAVVV